MRDYLTFTLRHKVNEQLVIRKDMDVNEHERLSNFILRHKVTEQLVITISFLITSCSVTLCLSIKLDNLSCSFTSISFLITSCSVTLCLSIKLDNLLDMDVKEHERLFNITLRYGCK
jgi:hypothetical protein